MRNKLSFKYISVVLILFILVSVVPMAVYAANSPDASIIKNVEITGVHTPYAGYRPDYGSRLGSTSYTYDDQLKDDPDVYNGKWWYDETEQRAISPSETFKIGHTYTFCILLVPVDGYEFRVDNYNTPFISATVNGEEADVLDDLTGKYQAFIEYTFEPCDYNYEITKVEVNVEEPVAGGYPKFDAEILTPGVAKDETESPFCIESVAWYDCVNQTFLDPSHTFKEDGIYEANIYLTTLGDYYFSTNNDMTDVNVTINGKEGVASTGGKNDKYHIRVSCVVFGDIREEVNSVEITDIKAPAIGDNPDFTATPVGNSFYINGVFWTDITNSTEVNVNETDTFEAGHKYELQIWIRANENYKFRTDEDGYVDVSAVVNGEQAEVVPLGSEISAEITCEFTMPQPVVIDTAKVTQVTPPVAGKKPSFSAFAYTDGMEITEVKWYDDTDNAGTELTADSAFVEGHTYRVVVSLKTLAGHKFLWYDGYNEAEGFINGEKAIVYGSHEDDSLELGFVFAPCAEVPVTEPSNPIEPPSPTSPTEPDNSTNPTIPTDPAGTTAEPDVSTSTEATEPKTSASEDEEKPTKPSTNDEPKPTDPVEDRGVLGDVNGDDKVNIKDATLIQKSAAKITVLTDVENLRADVNGDTKVNVKDATAIQKYAAKIETGFHIGKPV
ncbi:MAG: dockerin type I repeat-containing protein [Ruminococcus sp.]|nr:dockerin type I repeat-containing protein [Ruminococcus sp.]